MGKKAKIGKDRKDKFYKLAKETGFRSRAAFKLIQLNRKFGFLQQSQVCIDLCAAPGGWMQVAKQNMPVSSIVVGVDLFPIKSVPGCISLVEDITTDKCKQALTRELQTWKADVVLHDGAPNVGKNWVYDAYQQICLTLNAVKLATHFLRGGGWFVTKVFRSKDYNALLWVLKQLFKKVHATKPSASRKESAEIFVVCQYFIAPERIDPKLLDARYVFEELDLNADKTVSLLHPDASKRIRAQGYSDKEFAQRSVLRAAEFMAASSGLNALQGIGEIVFEDAEDERVSKHAKTTAEIRACCKDIKVLGRKDMRQLLAWWKTVRSELHPVEPKVVDEPPAEEPRRQLTAEELEDMEQDDLERHIAELEADAGKDDKRKKKKVQKERARLNERLNLKMVIKGDPGPREEDNEVFSLRDITSAAMLDELQDQSPDALVDEDAVQGDEFMPKYKRYVKGETVIDDDGQYHDGSAAESDDDGAEEADIYADDSDDSERLGKLGLDLGSDAEEDGRGHDRRKKNGKKLRGAAARAEATAGRAEANPLLDDLDTRDKDSKRQQRVQLWFEKDTLRDIDEQVDEDQDLDRLTTQYRQKGVRVLGEATNNERLPAASAPAKNDRALGKKAKRRARHTDGADADSDDDDDDEASSDDGLSEDEAELHQTTTTRREGGTDGYDVVAAAAAKPKRIKLDEEELALGALMVQSRKARRDLTESAWNRYAFNDDNLPEWFVADELVNMRKEAPVPKELADEYRKKLDELNVRPLKKVMEAKARKKRRAVKRFEKAKKKAEAVLENADSNAADKVRQIKKLYKKAQDEKKKEVEYVVTRRHLAAKRIRRPAGVKGRFKVVDPRMKKDKRAAVNKEKTKGRGKKR